MDLLYALLDILANITSLKDRLGISPTTVIVAGIVLVIIVWLISFWDDMWFGIKIGIAALLTVFLIGSAFIVAFSGELNSGINKGIEINNDVQEGKRIYDDSKEFSNDLKENPVETLTNLASKFIKGGSRT